MHNVFQHIARKHPFLRKGRLFLLSTALLIIVIQQGCSTHNGSPVSGDPLAVTTREDSVSDGPKEDDVDLSEALKGIKLEIAKGALNDFLSEWEGTPYRLGANSSKSIDCSALTSRIYKKLFNIDLPRTVQAQASRGNTIARSDLQPGDLVFFKTGRYQRHVGVYMGGNSFMHASTRKGVTVSSLDNPYWRGRFWKATSHHHM